MRALARVIVVAAYSLAVIAFADPPAVFDGNDYEWQLPPGFPLPLVPAHNPMSKTKVALGCRLFFERRLSSTGTYSCATCHLPERAFTDGRSHALGATGSATQRGAMTLTNAAYDPAYTWANDRVATLEAQMEQPLFNEHPIEMGLKRGDAHVATTLAQDASYAAAFAASFPDDQRPVTLHNIIKAIAAFERTLISGQSSFDRYVYADDRGALSVEAKQGMALFFSDRAGCAHCHFGVNFSGPIRHRAAPKQAAAFANNGAHDGAKEADRGLMSVTTRKRDLGRFRVPTLRNVELTAPYMHDGRLATLDAVIDHYASAGRSTQGEHTPIDPAIRALDLTAQEKQGLVEFLRSLTDREFVTRDYEKECAGVAETTPATLPTARPIPKPVESALQALSHVRSSIPVAATR
jgi:cytochrome c peroxidase